MMTRNRDVLMRLLEKGWKSETFRKGSLMQIELDKSVLTVLQDKSAKLFDMKYLFILYLLCLPEFREEIRQRSCPQRFYHFFLYANEIVDALVTGSKMSLIDADLGVLTRKSGTLSRVYSKNVIVLEMMRFSVLL